MMHGRAHHAGATTRRATVGVLALAIVLAGLLGLDHPFLTPPVPGPVSGWGVWMATVGPVGVLVTGLRVAAIAMTGHLLLAACLHVVAATGVTRLAGLAHVVTTPRTHDVLAALLGAGLVATTVGSPTAMTPPSTDGAVAPPDQTGHDRPGPGRRPDRPRSETTAAAAEDPELSGPAPRLRRLAMSDETPTMTRLDDRGRTTADDEMAAATGGEEPRSWTVRPGDHFWHIAEAQVGRSGAAPTRRRDARIAAYWRRLVHLNLDRLVDPGNPDLLVPGQVVLLPPADCGADR